MDTRRRDEQGRLYPAHPRVGVGVVVVRDGRVLLVRRGRPPRVGRWSIPGGLQQLGETVEAAARREVAEETGLVLGPLRLVAVVDLIERDPDGRVRRHYTLIDYAARAEPGCARAASDAAELCWLPPAEALRRVDWTRTREVLRRGLALLGVPPPDDDGA